MIAFSSAAAAGVAAAGVAAVATSLALAQWEPTEQITLVSQSKG